MCRASEVQSRISNSHAYSYSCALSSRSLGGARPDHPLSQAEQWAARMGRRGRRRSGVDWAVGIAIQFVYVAILSVRRSVRLYACVSAWFMI